MSKRRVPRVSLRMARTVYLVCMAALAFALCFASLIGLIRAQPYDDSALRTLLALHDGCPLPCFMGIRPGITTAEEAIALLENHEWVGEVGVFFGSRDFSEWNDGRLDFTWSGKQPPFVNARRRGILELDQVRSSQDTSPEVVVVTIFLYTNVRFHDLYDAFGLPERAFGARGISQVRYAASYYTATPYASIGIAATFDCPATLASYWNARAELWIAYTTYTRYVRARPPLSPEDALKLC